MSLADWIVVLVVAAFLALGVVACANALGRDSERDGEEDPPPPGPDSYYPPL